MEPLKIHRFDRTDTYQNGIVTYHGDFICFTLERPYLGNQPFISSIPCGEYSLRPWQRPNGDQCYMILGGSVCALEEGLDPAHGITRFLILIHAANWPSELAGYIAPGLSYAPGYVGPSRAAMAKLRGKLNAHFSTEASLPLVIS